jgi:hypothetical protein
VIAESLLLKHQLIVLNRARNRASRLTPWDRLLFGIGAFWVGITVRQAVDATAYGGSRTLRDRVRKLASMQLGEGTALVKLQALMRQCERATERRNDLVHGIWAREWDGEPVLFRSDHRAGPPPTRR